MCFFVAADAVIFVVVVVDDLLLWAKIRLKFVSFFIHTKKAEEFDF